MHRTLTTISGKSFIKPPTKLITPSNCVHFASRYSRSIYLPSITLATTHRTTHARTPHTRHAHHTCDPHVLHLPTQPHSPLTNHSHTTLHSLLLYSQATPDQFRKEPNRHMITNSINTTLAGIVPDYNSELKDKLWSAIDMEVDLQRSDIYSYIPDMTSDPFTEDGVMYFLHSTPTLLLNQSS
jgi:Maf1 regulator